MTDNNDLRDLNLRPRINVMIGQRNELARRLNRANARVAEAAEAGEALTADSPLLRELDELRGQVARADAELKPLQARYQAAEAIANAEADARFLAECEMFTRTWDGAYPFAGSQELRTIKELEDAFGPLGAGDFREVLMVANAAQREAERLSSSTARASDARRAEHLQGESATAYAKAQELNREAYRGAIAANPEWRASVPSMKKDGGWLMPGGSTNNEYNAARAAWQGSKMKNDQRAFGGPVIEYLDSDDPSSAAEGAFVRASDRLPAAVARGQRFGEHGAMAREMRQSASRDQAVVGQHGSLGQMLRSMSTSSGSAIVPSVWAADVIDRARNLSAVLQAGAQLVPMDAKIVQIGRLTGDPTAGFRAEGSAITASDPTFDNVTLTATTMNALVVGSLEWFQDAENADTIIENAIAQAMATQLDLVALYGGITAGAGAINLASPPNPKGILAQLAASAPSSILGAAANGTTQTAASFYNELLDTVYTPRDHNETPNAVIWNSKLARMYAKAYDSTYQPLRRPADLDTLAWFTSNQIPSYTQGTMTSVATDVFAGDFSQLLIGQRLDLQIQTLVERYADNGQIGIVATWRGDVGIARPRAFSIYRGLKGSA